MNTPQRGDGSRGYRALVVAGAARLDPGAVAPVIPPTLVPTERPKRGSWRARYLPMKGARNDRSESLAQDAGE